MSPSRTRVGCAFVDNDNFGTILREYAGTFYDDLGPIASGNQWLYLFEHSMDRLGVDLLRVYWYLPERIEWCNGGDQGEDHDESLRARARRELDQRTERANEIAMRWDRVTFRRSGSRKFDLGKGKWSQEKGVDVAIASDMVLLAPIYDLALLVSGDADFVPVIRAVKSLGKTVAVLRFRRGPDLAPAEGGTKTDVIQGQAKALFIEADQVLDIRESSVAKIGPA
jgi:uncharacterized LabA/DUF88 family protein